MMAKERKYSLWIEVEVWAPGSWRSDDISTNVIVEWENGDRWVASFITYKHIQTIREKFKTTGECLSGKYFWMSDMILIEDINRPLLQQVIDDLIKSGEFACVFTRIPKEDEEESL
jgi:hypothetical protein